MNDLSAELVERIQSGDRDAWDHLYLRYRDALLFTIRCRLGNALRSRLESEDVLHSVIRDALGDLEGFEHRSPGALGHYLHVCALNKIRSKAEYFGAAKRDGAVGLTDSILAQLPDGHGGDGGDGGECEPRYIDDERYGRLERAVQTLPENLREPLLLRTIEGLSNVEAAEVLGLSPAATSKAYNRAVARVALLLETGDA